jgi:hypothetical protein
MLATSSADIIDALELRLVELETELDLLREGNLLGKDDQAEAVTHIEHLIAKLRTLLQAVRRQTVH